MGVAAGWKQWRHPGRCLSGRSHDTAALNHLHFAANGVLLLHIVLAWGYQCVYLRESERKPRPIAYVSVIRLRSTME